MQQHSSTTSINQRTTNQSINNAQHPGETVATQAKRIGARWKAAAPSEKERLQTLAKEEKQRLAVELEEYLTKYGDALAEDGNNNNNSNTNNNGDDPFFPLARIRKIAKLDPEVKTLSKEALQLVVRATEMALAKLGNECVKTARIKNRRTLMPEDVARVCAHGVFSFLKDDVRDLTRALAESSKQKKQEAALSAGAGANNNGNNNNNNNNGAIAATSKSEKARQEAASGSKPLTSYFGTAPSNSKK